MIIESSIGSGDIVLIDGNDIMGINFKVENVVTIVKQEYTC